jgi:hypothetical protein
MRLTRFDPEHPGEPQSGEVAAAGDLAALDMAALGFEGTVAAGGGILVRACAIDVEGDLRELASRSGTCGARSLQCVHVEILGELLTRGLRARRPILAAADGCPTLVARLRAAFGSQNVVLVPDRER